MKTTLHEVITLEEFLRLPETKPASEFIKGGIYQKPMPQGKHSRIQLKLCDAVNQFAEERNIALAFPKLRCTFGGRSIVPDATVFSWGRIPFDADGEIANVFNIHPDVTIEILSPDQKPTKVIGTPPCNGGACDNFVISNILHCLKHGTQLGWFIDPDERTCLAFLPNQQLIELTGDNKLPMPEFLELNLSVAQVFSWLKAG